MKTKKSWAKKRENELALMEQEIKDWKHTLRHTPDKAQKIVSEKIKELTKAGFPHDEIVRANSRMLAGTVVPHDYRVRPTRVS